MLHAVLGAGGALVNKIDFTPAPGSLYYGGRTTNEQVNKQNVFGKS